MLKAKEVNAVISRFETSKSQDMMVLMQDAKFLSTQLYFYAELLGECGHAYREAYVERKTAFSRLVVAYKEKGENNGASEHLANQDESYVKLRRTEVDYESRYDKGKLMFKAIEHVISRMNQEIAELRKERSYNNYTGA